MKKKITILLLITSLVLVVGTACGRTGSEGKKDSGEEKKEIINPEDPIIVSTMNDTEGEILGRMMVLALEDAGYEVTDNTFGYTGTVNGRTALLEGETDIYMDYTGRGLRLIEGVDETLYHQPDTAYKSVASWDKETNHLIWMAYAPFNNTDAVAVTSKFAEENHVYTMEEFAKYVNGGGKVKLLAHEYWITLATGLPGMEEAYGFKLTENQYTMGGANNEQMLSEGTDGINACTLYSSSGLIDTYGLVVLKDDKMVSPVYCPCPIIREERLEKYPGIQKVLDPVFESISLDEMVEMNEKVQVDGESGMDVAREYLESKDLIGR